MATKKKTSKKKTSKKKTAGRWRFAFVTSEGQDEGGRDKLNIRGIADAPHAKLSADLRTVREYGGGMAIVEAVQLNMQEFLQAIVDRAVVFERKRTLAREEFDALCKDFSRLIVNLLTMFRIFLEHTDTSLARKFGKASEEVAIWKGATAAQYDSTFAYRLVYGLRNYCLHIGMPPLTISYRSAVDEEGIVFRIDLQRDALLAEESCWNSTLIRDLRSQQAVIPLMELLDEWSKSFWRVAHVALTIQQKGALVAAKRMLGYRKALGLPPEGGELCAILFPEGAKNPDALNLKVMHLDEDMCRKVVAGPSWSPDS